MLLSAFVDHRAKDDSPEGVSIVRQLAQLQLPVLFSMAAVLETRPSCTALCLRSLVELPTAPQKKRVYF